jgi:hypothetical protein
MKRMTALVTSLATVLLGTGCADIPESPTSEDQFASLSCELLRAEQARAEESRRAADDAASHSWEVVLPVAVLVRYESADSAMRAAERRMGLLRAQIALKECPGSSP